MVSSTKTRMRDTLEMPPWDPNEEPDFTGQPWDLLNYQIQALRDDIRAANWDTEKAGAYEPLPVPQMKAAGEVVDSAVRAEQMAELERIRRAHGARQVDGDTAIRTIRD